MMSAIKGIPITIYTRRQTGVDGFGRPQYTEVAETVDNVLVGSPTTEDITNELNLSGKRIAYVLAIPKGDKHDWSNVTVGFFGSRYRTIGLPMMGIEEMIPLAWHKKVKVERYNAETSKD